MFDSIRMRSVNFFAILLLILTIALTTTGGANAKRHDPDARRLYVLGVFPFASPLQLLKTHAPMVVEFSKVLGRKVIFRTKRTPREFIREIGLGKYDIIITHGFIYVDAHDRQGYLPLARYESVQKAIIVVREASALRSPRDLKGVEIGIAPLQSAAIPARFALKKIGLIAGRDYTIRDFKNNHDCLQQLLIGKIEACGVVPISLRFFYARRKLGGGFRIVMDSPAVPSSLFAVHPRVPEPDRRRLKEAIVSWRATPEGRALLKKTRYPPFVPTSDREYDVIREMKKKVGK